MISPPAFAISAAGALGIWLVCARSSGATAGAGNGILGVALTRLSESESLRSRLATVGEHNSRAFRVRQLMWAATAGAGAMAVAVAGTLSGAAVALGSTPLTAVVSGAAAFAALELNLNARVRRRRAQIAARVPAISDLICLGVVAGESLRSAIARSAEEAGGVLGDEFKSCLRDVAGGNPLIPALDSMAERAGVASLSRLVSAISLAHERGTPLAEQLQAITTEIRADERRRLLEAAGKSQTRMLIPVITLILPTALAFAFFPGFVALQAFVP